MRHRSLITEKAPKGHASRSESAEEHRPVEQPIAITLHQRRFFPGIIRLGTRVDREDRVLFCTRRLDQRRDRRVSTQLLTILEKRAGELSDGIVWDISVSYEIRRDLQRGDTFFR